MDLNVSFELLMYVKWLDAIISNCVWTMFDGGVSYIFSWFRIQELPNSDLSTETEVFSRNRGDSPALYVAHHFWVST